MRKSLILFSSLTLSLAGIASATPKVGDPLPDVSAFDESGKAFHCMKSSQASQP